VEEGLHFRSFTVDKDSRTGLNLTPEGPLSLPGGFTLTFDFKIRRETDIFGYIFRIIGDRETNIDLISNIETNNLVLVAENTTLLDFITPEVVANAQNGWIKAELRIDTEKNRLEFALNGNRKSANYDIRRLKTFGICFGRNSENRFATTDVAPLILKNVRIFDGKNRLTRHWILNKHGDDCVFDECKSAKAIATNSEWEIDRRAEWQKRATVTVAGQYPQIAFDREQKRVFIVKDELIYIYDAEKDITSTIKSERGIPFDLKINQMIYDSATDRLIMYEFTKNRLVRFDFVTKEWNNDDDSLAVNYFMHHNKYFDGKKRTVYTFGGYGFHQYSALLQSFSEAARQWESADLSAVIHPRYLAAMGVWSDSLLLCFGGFGNASGKQYESPHNYYDLHVINPHTRKVDKIWELTQVDRHFTNSNSLVVNQANRTFYTLSYPNNVFETQAFLHEYSLQAPEFRRLGNPIPFLFNDVESLCDLFLPSDSSALFAVTSYMDGNDSRIDIHSIAYPPLSMADTLQAENDTTAFPHAIYLLILIPSAIVIYLAAKRIMKARRIRSVLKTIESNDEPDKNVMVELEEHKTVYPAIHLLNVFEVLDSKGANISGLFTPILSQMFIILYLRTMDGGKGITSGELQKSLWPDKDYESAQNNRNVYFNKLRPILNMTGNIRLCRTKDYWMLSYERGTIFCDYETVMNNISLIGKNAPLDRELLLTTLRIAKKGKLLPLYESEWFDNYKTAYVNTFIEVMLNLTEHPDIKKDLPLLLSIANIILIQDSLEESAVRLKCGILYKLGKKKQALQCYNKYAEEHNEILNIKPELTFDEIVKYGGTGAV
jgi:DNA-binding SARP family transcriptional activator